MENDPIKVLARHLYTIDATTTCTVSTADGIIIGTFEPGKQGAFIAPENDLIVSDPEARITEIPRRGAAVAQAMGKVSTHVIDYGTVTESLDLSGYTIDTEGRNAATDELWLAFGDTTPQITWPDTWIWLDGEEPVFSPNTRYCVCVRSERNGNIIANLAYEY